MRLTKLDVAQREIIAAVRLLFGGGDPVAVCVLAASARGIATALCEKGRHKSYFDIALKHQPSASKVELHALANRQVNFFKHADKDPEAVLTDFKDIEADTLLFVATFDFAQVCKGQPIESQVFQAWYLSLQMSPEHLPDGAAELFPDLRALPRDEQLAEGERVLEWARNIPQFQMKYSLEFRLPPVA